MNKALIGFLLAAAPLLASSNTPPSLTTQDTNLHFALQINSSPENYTTLTIQLPSGYTALQSPEQWAASQVLEFIPSTESGDNWTHSITITKYLGKKLSASNVIAMIKSSLLSDIQNPQILEENTLTQQGYSKSSLTLSYDRNQGHEIMKALYYSGPVDCVGVQYTIRSSASKDDQQNLNEINTFFQNNVLLTSSSS